MKKLPRELFYLLPTLYVVRRRTDHRCHHRSDFARSPDESDPCFQPWLHDSGLWNKIVLDSNVAAQQEGIAALCAFLQYGGANACLRYRNDLFDTSIKCLY